MVLVDKTACFGLVCIISKSLTTGIMSFIIDIIRIIYCILLCIYIYNVYIFIIYTYTCILFTFNSVLEHVKLMKRHLFNYIIIPKHRISLAKLQRRTRFGRNRLYFLEVVKVLEGLEVLPWTF